MLYRDSTWSSPLRSAALLHLRRYEACLEDISLALDGGYPSHMQHKLYDRQGKCYIHLHRPSEAARSFRKAAEVLTTANLEDKARISWTNTINKQLSQCDKINEKPFKSDSLVAPEMDGERDPVYTHANSGLEVVYTDEERGRVVKATKNHRVGKLLVAEDPVASVLLPEFYLTNCYHCQATCRAPVPCYRCSNLAFCSRTCRQKAWDGYHQAEYRFQSLFGKDWCAKIGHLAVRLAVTMGCEAVVAFMKTAKESVKVGAWRYQGRVRMAAIWQTTFSNAFLYKMFFKWFKFRKALTDYVRTCWDQSQSLLVKGATGDTLCISIS